MYLENLYEELREADLVASAYEFSEKYLGRSRNYYSVLKARNMEPSIGAILTLEYVLNEEVDSIGTTNDLDRRAALGCLLMMSRNVASYRGERCKQETNKQDRITVGI